jgi:hypothetical protein
MLLEGQWINVWSKPDVTRKITKKVANTVVTYIYVGTFHSALRKFYTEPSMVLPTKFRFIWLFSFRGEDYLEIDQSETRITYGGHVINVWSKPDVTRKITKKVANTVVTYIYVGINIHG